ncbi:MAG: bifunctional folylpolyglutamate synthase/dihydrofolate synthase [Candidatus Zixiibacteriota bacterium]|nr:MAG: bifunctional folylpolyglutamate synthase/dihydrofolate synthase [candidate division Zixibacteria bacterium]
MDYRQAVSYLFDLEKFGIKLGLENITRFLDRIGNPHNRFPAIHVAGTNGKGSTAAILEALLTSAGFKVGLYTSPHLVDFRERIRIGKRPVEREYVTEFVRSKKDLIEEIPVTFFEVVSALAFSYFAEQRVNIAVCETGLGGRLDATNVLKTEVSIITNVDLEHTDHLGSSVSEIAREKAGIIKEGVPTVTASNNFEVKRVLRNTCRKRKAPLVSIYDEAQWLVKEVGLKGSRLDVFTRSNKYVNLRLNLVGRHQLENAMCALLAIEILQDNGWRVPKRAVREGLAQVVWRGRLELLSKRPMVLADVAHNPPAMKIIKENLQELFPEKRFLVVLGILSNKNYVEMLNEVGRFAKVIYLTKPITERAADPELLAREVSKQGLNFKVIPVVKEAYKYALSQARPGEVVLVTGSHYTVGEVMAALSQEIGDRG